MKLISEGSKASLQANFSLACRTNGKYCSYRGGVVGMTHVPQGGIVKVTHVPQE